MRILDNKNPDNWMLLSNLSNKGLSLLKEQNGMFCPPNLNTTLNVLKKINVNTLKTDTQNLLLYVASLYCLSNIDQLSFPMSVYESFTDLEEELKKKMVDIAKNILEQLLQS